MKKEVAAILRQIMIILISLVLLFNIFLIVVVMQKSRSAMKVLVDKRMMDVAKTAADMIDGDALSRLRADGKDTSDYKGVLDTLGYFRDNINDLKYIYCIKQVSDKEFVFSADPTILDPGEFGEPVVYTEALYEASRGITSVDSVPYEDDWGTFYSAYSPVYDSFGGIAGILAVDFSAEWYDAQVEYFDRYVLAGCFAYSLTQIAIFLYGYNRIMRLRFRDPDEPGKGAAYEKDDTDRG